MKRMLKSLWMLGLLMTVVPAAVGCSDDDEMDEETGTAPSTCTRDSDCGSGNYCDMRSAVPGAQKLIRASLDMNCLGACLFECDISDDACDEDCIMSCGGGDMSCNDLCSLLCEGDTVCNNLCVFECEAETGTGGSTGTGGGIPSDEGSSDTTEGSSDDSATGTCRPIAQPSDTDSPAGTDGGTDTDTSSGTGGETNAMVWAGTWNVRAVYTTRCQWSSAGAPRETNQNHMVSANITGENSSLSAVFANNSGYTMTGTGSNSRMTLSGQFPGRDHNNNVATTTRVNNNVTIVVNDIIDSNTTTGTIEGSYETSGGIACTIQAGGTVEITR